MSEGPGFLRAAKFQREEDQLGVYTRIESLVLRHSDSLSCYRLFERNSYSWYVVVLGDIPRASIARAVGLLLARGEPLELPAESVNQLWELRKERNKLGNAVIGHYPQGMRLGEEK